jgi:ATP-dependent protease ClpP protease subunit
MNGTVLGVTQSLRYFERMQDRITDFITKNSNIAAPRLRELMLNTKQMTMDIGTVLDGEDAVKEGLIDRLGGLSDAIDALYEMIENSPKKYA